MHMGQKTMIHLLKSTFLPVLNKGGLKGSLGPFHYNLSHRLLINKLMHTLTTHNLQKRKRVFPTCPCHKIYGDEAVGLKSCKYT